MAKRNIPDELSALLQQAQASMPELREIAQVYVSPYASDASTMIRSGCVLLSVATVNNDEDGDGFRFLLGLPRGVQVTPYLGNYFVR